MCIRDRIYKGEVLTQTLRTTPRTLDTSKPYQERRERPRRDRRDGDRRQGGFKMCIRDSPLATRELLHMKLWSWWTDSNPRPADYKSAALPAELHQHLSRRLSNSKGYYNRRLGFCQVLF